MSTARAREVLHEQAVKNNTFESPAETGREK
jgi:hypothetical protein